MNVTNQTVRFLALGTLLALAISLSPSVVRGAIAPTSRKAAQPVPAAVTPSDASAMVCGACKTTAITDRQILPGAKAGTALFTVGSKHECAMCGGEIVTVNGKTTETMQHGCKLCGSATTSCCAPAAEAKKS